MHKEDAESIVREALSSRTTYEEMAAREAAAWSKQAQLPQRAAVQKMDQSAASQLGLNDHGFSFADWCRRSQKRFKRGLSVGCGAGRAERQFLKLGICETFHGIDIAADAIASAKQQAEESHSNCSYELADLNFADFGAGKYDLVIAQTSLHHMVHLESVFTAIDRALTPDGIFWMNDFVGESQFQHSDLRLSIANSLLEQVPQEFRINQLNKSVIGPVSRRKPGTLISPFEAIRSGEILPLANRMFDFVAGRVSVSILHIVCPVGTRSHYLKNAESIALFRALKRTDELLIENSVLEGTDAKIVFAKRQTS